MKNTKRCPKCSSNEIYRVEAVVGNGYGSGNIIPTSIIGTIKVNRYICGRCGYAENGSRAMTSTSSSASSRERE